MTNWRCLFCYCHFRKFYIMIIYNILIFLKIKHLFFLETKIRAIISTYNYMV